MAIKRVKKVAKAAKSKEKKPVRSSRSTPKEPAKGRSQTKKRTDNKPQKPEAGSSIGDRKIVLKQILLDKRDALTQAMRQQLGQSLTDEQQRRLEAAMDSGDQALVDLEREMGISLQEMRNRERQLVEEAIISLKEGSYGECAECGEEISEKRLEALPFARLCVACQSKRELMEKIERAEQRS
jgi:DnaK suppressor protein